MKKKTLVVAMLLVLSLFLASCGGGGNKKPSVEELKTYRELSWEGTELTVKLGKNKTSGCNWSNEFGDDSIIDYSINRKFTLSDKAAMKGLSAGILSAGFEGKRGRHPDAQRLGQTTIQRLPAGKRTI